MDNYFNTTNESGEQLESNVQAAKNQTAAILAIFVNKPFRSFTPSEVFNEIFLVQDEMLLTSVRRAITTLTKAGKLTKLVKKRIGLYGRQEYCWMASSDSEPIVTKQISENSNEEELDAELKALQEELYGS